MVIGNGMIAKRFHKYTKDNRFVVFASGVSNSANVDKAEFEREQLLLQKSLIANADKVFVYISTCSIYDPSLQLSAYVLHKLHMEKIIADSGITHVIFRVSNPIGHTSNSHTFLNYFIQHIVQKTHFNLWKYASRNLIDLDDMYKLADYFLQKENSTGNIINLANPINYSVLEIAKAIEHYYNIQGNYAIVEKGSSPLIDTTAVQPFLIELGIDFNSIYLHNLLLKYYPLA